MTIERAPAVLVRERLAGEDFAVGGAAHQPGAGAVGANQEAAIAVGQQAVDAIRDGDGGLDAGDALLPVGRQDTDVVGGAFGLCAARGAVAAEVMKAAPRGDQADFGKLTGCGRGEQVAWQQGEREAAAQRAQEVAFVHRGVPVETTDPAGARRSMRSDQNLYSPVRMIARPVPGMAKPPWSYTAS